MLENCRENDFINLLFKLSFKTNQIFGVYAVLVRPDDLIAANA